MSNKFILVISYRERHTFTIVLTSLLCLFNCTVCKDVRPICADLALAGQCIEGDTRLWMLTNCPQSCGLCQGRTRSCLQINTDIQQQLPSPSSGDLFSSMFVYYKGKRAVNIRRLHGLLMGTWLKQTCDKRLIDTACVHGTRASKLKLRLSVVPWCSAFFSYLKR